MRLPKVSRGEFLLSIAYAGVASAILVALIVSGHELTGGENAVANCAGAGAGCVSGRGAGAPRVAQARDLRRKQSD